MATKLKNLKITKVDFVDDGANPEAHIKLFKSKDGQGNEEPAEGNEPERKPNFWKRLLRMIEKAAETEDMGTDDIEKITKGGAVSFGEKANEIKNRKIADEIWDLCYALQSSLCSIINDDELDGTKATNAMNESLSEFDDVLKNAITNWSAGKSASIAVKETTVTMDMALMKANRDRLDALIEKSIVTEKKGPAENVNPEAKGAEDMKIDKSKLTPAERAFLEDIEKRCGTDDGTESAKPAQGEVAKNNSTPVVPILAVPHNEDTEDIYKGINPAVKAELDALKKFRESIEEKELKEVCKRYAIIGKKEEELLPVFKSLKATGGTAYNDMIAVLDQAVETVEKSNVFSEIGKSGGAEKVNGEAWAQAEVKAGEIMKSKNVTKAQALDEVFRIDPELAQKCEEEE